MIQVWVDENPERRYNLPGSSNFSLLDKIIPMADNPNPDKTKLWQQFYLLEDKQTSIDKLIAKLNSNIRDMDISN